MIAALVITDGRNDLLRHTMSSFDRNVDGPIVERWIYDDSGDHRTREWIAEEYPNWTLIQHATGERQGFSGAIRTAWSALRRESIADWVFHLEADFTFNRPIDLTDLQAIMDKRPRLAQIALLRQAWSKEEKAAGGIVQLRPDHFRTHLDGERMWLEHHLFFTTNPTLYRRSLIEMFDWPDRAGSEGRFGQMLRDAGYHFAFWGSKDDPPAVHHIGHIRAGKGY